MSHDEDLKEAIFQGTDSFMTIDDFPYPDTFDAFRSLLERLVLDIHCELKVGHALRDALQRIEKTRIGVDKDFSFDDPLLVHAAYAFRNPEKVELPEDFIRRLPPGYNLRNRSLNWIKVGVQAMVTRYLHLGDASFHDLQELRPKDSVKLTRDPRLAIFGDAGYRGLAQDKVKTFIKNRHVMAPFDALIHLGDVYYAGTKEDMLEHFLAQFRSVAEPPYRLFAVPGNHDIYFGGKPFELTVQDLPQPGRYFLIETPNWRIVCLDTALGDPSLSRTNGLLDPEQLTWFQNIIRKADTRPIILLTHHYFVSAWNSHGESLRAQIGNLIKDKVFAWYWGHEHACATYNRGDHGFYGACVGNGAFREAFSGFQIDFQDALDSYPESRCNCFGNASDEWPHGFLELELGKGVLKETYHVENLAPPLLRTLKVT